MILIAFIIKVKWKNKTRCLVPRRNKNNSKSSLATLKSWKTYNIFKTTRNSFWADQVMALTIRNEFGLTLSSVIINNGQITLKILWCYCKINKVWRFFIIRHEKLIILRKPYRKTSVRRSLHYINSKSFYLK